MAVIKELIRAEADGSLSFGNYELDQKTKLSDFAHQGDLYKVKTFQEITKLEKNGMFVYESVPGTAVTNLSQDGNRMAFTVEGNQDAQITVELEADTEYDVRIAGTQIPAIKTNLGGKLSLSLELENASGVSVEIVKK